MKSDSPKPWRAEIFIVGGLLMTVATIGWFLVANIANRNETFICGMSDLISYVPAGQFPEETKQEFLGWVRARGELLNDAIEVECEQAIIGRLQARIAEDNLLIEELE